MANCVQRKLDDADLAFLDPDNGLEPVRFRPTVAKSGNEQRSGPVSQGIFADLDAVVD
jgi:hypothetical protein